MLITKPVHFLRHCCSSDNTLNTSRCLLLFLLLSLLLTATGSYSAPTRQHRFLAYQVRGTIDGFPTITSHPSLHGVRVELSPGAIALIRLSVAAQIREVIKIMIIAKGEQTPTI